MPSSTCNIVTMENTFMLAACSKDEDLPQNPNLPADLFTACLTTPIRMALRWHWLRHQEYFPGYVDEALLDRIPGSHSNRMSLLGEINWIFTAVTDTIAWCSFPLDIFQKLFRQDLLIASLFRNFLLAERIMKYYGCHPVSAPLLLPTYEHSMWDAWDHTLDRVIHYLPRMLKIIEGGTPYTEKLLPIINSTSNTIGQSNSSQQTNNYDQVKLLKTVGTNNCNNNPNNNRVLPTGVPTGTNYLPPEVSTVRSRHFSTHQQPHPQQQLPQAITGLPPKQVKTTIPSACVYPPSNKPHNMPTSQQNLLVNNVATAAVTSNPTFIASCNTVTTSLVSNNIVSSTITTCVSKPVVTMGPPGNCQIYRSRQLTGIHEENNNQLTNQQYGILPNCHRAQQSAITTKSYQTSVLASNSKAGKLVSGLGVPPPGFSKHEDQPQQRQQESKLAIPTTTATMVTKNPVFTTLIDSRQDDQPANDAVDLIISNNNENRYLAVQEANSKCFINNPDLSSSAHLVHVTDEINKIPNEKVNDYVATVVTMAGSCCQPQPEPLQNVSNTHKKKLCFRSNDVKPSELVKNQNNEDRLTDPKVENKMDSNSNDGRDDSSDDDSAEDSETDGDDDDDDDVDVDEEDDDDDDYDDGEEVEDKVNHQKFNKTPTNVENTITRPTVADTTAKSTNTNKLSGSNQFSSHSNEICHESKMADNTSLAGTTVITKLTNKTTNKTQLSRSASCSQLYTRSSVNTASGALHHNHNYFYQHTTSKRQTTQQQRVSDQQQELKQLCKQITSTVHQPSMHSNNNMTTTANVTSINMTETEKSTNNLTSNCRRGITNEINDGRHQPYTQNNELQNVPTIKYKLKNDPSSKQTENLNKYSNLRTSRPMKPYQSSTHTHYPHGYEESHLLPNGNDGTSGACQHRVNNCINNKLTAVHQLLESTTPAAAVASSTVHNNLAKQYLDPRTFGKLPTTNTTTSNNDISSNRRVNLLNNLTHPNKNHSDGNSKSQLKNYADTIPLSSTLISSTSTTTIITASTTTTTATTTTTTTTVCSGSVIGGSGPSSFFTSQMTAFKIWLQTADERHPVATQLPILLQILLSQSHRIRAMQLLSEFLDLGPWAVVHCLSVGIFPYIVRLFHSPVSEVKPYLVFIWGKIIASAQTEFGRNDSVRDFGYNYFITCLSDTENLSPLTRTITAFALAKMLEKNESEEPDPFFQDVYLKQNFLPIVLTQLFDNTPTQNTEMLIRMRLWLILSLAKLWCKNDEARWFGIRHNLPEVLLAYLNDISPEVRAATVYALGNLIENQTTDSSKQHHADQISHEIGGQLVKHSARDASPLVRSMVVEAFRGLVKQFESQLCAIGIQYIQEICVKQSQIHQQQLQNSAKLSAYSTSPYSTKRPMRHSTISIVTPSGSGNPAGVLHTSRQSCTSFNTHLLGSSGGGSGNTPSTNIYVQFWLTLVQLAQDPYPKISRLATILVHFLYEKIREKAEFQAICGSNNNNENVISPSSPEDAALISLSNVSSSLNSSLINESNNPVGNHLVNTSQASSCSEHAFIEETNPNNLTTSTSTTAFVLQTAPVNTCSSSLIHSAQFPGRRYQQTDQRLRLSITNPPELSNTMISKQSVTCPLPAAPTTTITTTATATTTTTTTTSSSTSGNYSKLLTSLDTVHTKFFAWSCRWFTRPLLSKYGQLNQNHTTTTTTTTTASKSTIDYEPISLGKISVDPNAVAYTDRVNRLKQQRKISHLGRMQWECIAGQAPHSTSPTSNNGINSLNRYISMNYKNPTNNCISSKMSRSRISLRSSDSSVDSNTNDSMNGYYLHPVALYNHPNDRNTVFSIPNQVKFHPYQPHLVMADPHRGVVIHSTKNLKLYSRVGYVTDIEFINAAEEHSLLLTATDDGYIRIWRNYTHHLGQDSEILTAWNGITDLYQTDYPVGVVVHWSQQSNQLSVSGDTRVIRLWDCLCESRLRDINTGSDTSVTCLTQNADQNLLAAGFNDGGIRVWDVRIPSHSGYVCNNTSANDNLVFNSQADSSRIYKVVFSSTNRLYAVGAMGGIGAWHLSYPTGNNNNTSVSFGTTSTINNSMISSNRMVTVDTTNSHDSLSNHPSRYISTVVRSSHNNVNVTNNSSNSTSSRRFRRLPCPPRLSLPVNSSVNCADLLVDLSSPHAHLVLTGIRGQSSISLHRIQDGSLHSSIKHFDNMNSIINNNENNSNNNNFSREQFGLPTCCAFHPNQALIAAGFYDRTLLLLNVEKRILS
ncbi:Regulatory-associated protein of mTOR isoform 2 [Schistosoma japonicum]|nr:Regulatory-associated protein of mTOR isoform 2 [Schistosoma japonicum]